MNFKSVAACAALLLAPTYAIASNCNLMTDTSRTERFEINGQTVTDLNTGLVWNRCLLGQQWDGEQCIGEPSQLAWTQALHENHNDAVDGWRIPNAKELQSIVELNCTYFFDRASINKKLFPWFPYVDGIVDPDSANGIVWTSTPDPSRTDSAMMVNFLGGVVDRYTRTRDGMVMLVRD